MPGRYSGDSYQKLGYEDDTSTTGFRDPAELGSYTLVHSSLADPNAVLSPCPACGAPLAVQFQTGQQLANVNGRPIHGQGASSSGRKAGTKAERAARRRARYAQKYLFRVERDALDGPDMFTLAAQLPELQRRAEDSSRALAEGREHWRTLYHDDDLPEEARQELRELIGRDQLAQTRVISARRRQEWLSANYPVPRIDEPDPWAQRAAAFGPVLWDENHPHPGSIGLGDGWDRS
jgi:hypothetical protein